MAAAAVVLAVASALWYAGFGSSRGPANAPGTPLVSLDATQTGSGSWVRYLLTVENHSDYPFTGDLLLVDRDEDATADTASPQLPSTTRPPSLPTQGTEVAPESAYQVHATLAPHQQRIITVVAPDSFNTALVVDPSGAAVTDPVDVARSPVVPVAVLSDVETAAGGLAKVVFDRYATRVASFSGARAFPATPLLLGTYAAVVVDQFDTATLSGRQLAALREYVGLGGALVLVGGSTWRRTLAPLPPELLPLRPAATATASLAPVAALAGVNGEAVTVQQTTGSLAEGARAVLTAPDGSPLVAEIAYGAGRIVELAFDPADAAATQLATVAWTQAIGRAFAELPGGEPAVSSLPGPESNFSAYFGPPNDAPLPSPFLVGPLLLGYVLLVAPFNYWLLRRRRRAALLWFTAPLTALLFTGAFYVVGQSLQGSLQDHSVQVLKLAPDGAAAQIQYDRVLFLRRGDHVIQPATGALVAPLTLNTYRTTGSTCERCTVQLTGTQAGSERVLPGSEPAVEERGVVYGSVRVVGATTVGHAAVGLVSHLRVAGGHVQGTLANLGDRPARAIQMFSFDGQYIHTAYLAGFIAPGGLVQVDALAQQISAGPPPGVAGQGTEGVNLARALAAVSLERDGEPLLVGFTDPRPSSLAVDGGTPPTSTVTAFEQPAALEAADSLIADFSRRQLASTVGSQRDGYTDVYDITLPPHPAAGLALTYDRRWAQQLEVYDWAAGTWRSVPPPPGDENPQVTTRLAAGELGAGMVRVRVHEPRLSWGSTLSIDSSKPAG